MRSFGQLGGGGEKTLLRTLQIFLEQLDAAVRGGDLTFGLRSHKTNHEIERAHTGIKDRPIYGAILRYRYGQRSRRAIVEGNS